MIKIPTKISQNSLGQSNLLSKKRMESVLYFVCIKINIVKIEDIAFKYY